MPDSAPEKNESMNVTPMEKFVSGMKGYLETSGARMQMLQGLEPRGGSLTGKEGVRFLGGICQQVDDLIEREYHNKGKDFPGEVEAIQELSGHKLNKTIVEATEEALTPWLSELEAMKPTIEREISLLGEEAVNYPVNQIKGGKIIFAVNLLIASQSEQVTMLPQNMKKIFAVLRGGVASVRHGIAEEQRRRVVDWVRPVAGEHVEHPQTGGGYDWKGFSRQATEVVLSIAVALGLLWGASWVVTSPDVKKATDWVKKSLERAPLVGDKVADSAQDKRQKDYYQPIYETIVNKDIWPEGATGEEMVYYFDPASGYNNWKAIIEFCGPQCLLDPQWTPGAGKQAVMDFLGVDEAGYRALQDNPDQLDEQVAREYPDKPWLVDLFSMDFKQWMEQYSVQSSVINKAFSGLGVVRIVSRGQDFLARRNAFMAQSRGYNRGRGFGTTKGFS